jgi:hypothetical protein
LIIPVESAYAEVGKITDPTGRWIIFLPLDSSTAAHVLVTR